MWREWRTDIPFVSMFGTEIDGELLCVSINSEYELIVNATCPEQKKTTTTEKDPRLFQRFSTAHDRYLEHLRHVPSGFIVFQSGPYLTLGKDNRANRVSKKVWEIDVTRER